MSAYTQKTDIDSLTNYLQDGKVGQMGSSAKPPGGGFFVSKERRNQHIKELHDRGWNVLMIQQVYELSERQIYRIISQEINRPQT